MFLKHNKTGTQRLPGWVPQAAMHYLAHTENGQSIRALARDNDVHPSTILRQVRRFECRRDDPLIDDALRALSHEAQDTSGDMTKEIADMTFQLRDGSSQSPDGLTQARIDQEAKRILRRLCEQGAVLAVARDMENAVVVREDTSGESLRTAVVDREIAQAMALKDWIGCNDGAGRVARYAITNAGRAALRRLTAEDENRAHGFAEQRSTFDMGDAGWDVPQAAKATPRYHATESPLVGLSRRKDRDGKPFLDRDLVVVGERLREDFELSQIGPRVAQNWDGFMAGAAGKSRGDGPAGAMDACARVKSALSDLGPGLGDVVLRCCCFLEGLEVTEKKMGWSARSGKIVLRIALQRLKRHYEELGDHGKMIG